MAKRKSSGRTERYIPEFMRARSETSKKAWEKRWDRGTAPIGPKGQQYIQREYGPTVQAEEPGGYGYEEEREEYDDYDFWDSEY